MNIQSVIQKLKDNYKIIGIILLVVFIFVLAFNSSNKEAERFSTTPSFTSVATQDVLEEAVDDAQTPVDELLWSNVSLGTASLEDYTFALGERLSTDVTGEVTTYKFNKFSKNRPIVVETDAEGFIRYVHYPKEDLSPKDFSFVLEESGFTFEDPDLELYFRRQMDVNRVYVFLDEGIAFDVKLDSDVDGMVLGIRYFIPTTEDMFMKNWGSKLSKTHIPSGH
jgi:3',5'-cyclic AMP phosphodiesterase CpdA